MTPVEIALSVSTVILAAASFHNFRTTKKLSEIVDRIKKATRVK